MKTWEITKTLYKVSDFISWQRNGALLLNPNFQRRSVWKKGAKSYLLDTIIRGLPVPIIFLRERRSDISKLEPIREVVDGQQRLRTLISFIAPNYLKDFKPDKDDFKISKTHNKPLSNKRFIDLDPIIQQQILDYQFSVHILPASTDDREVLQIFGRMNSTGMKLNDQELRNAEFFGEFKTSVYETALQFLNFWRTWKIFTDDNISRMTEVEMTSELYILMLTGVTSKSQKTIDNFYKQYDETFNEREIIEYRFDAVMNELNKLGDFLPHSIFQKSTLFYILFASIYDLIFGINSELRKKTYPKLTSSLIEKIREIEKDIATEVAPINILEAASTRRATNITQRKLLVNYFKKRLK